MAQKMFALGMGSTGIVGTMVIIGLALVSLNVLPELGTLSISAGVLMGLLLGLLGVVSVAKRVIR